MDWTTKEYEDLAEWLYKKGLRDFAADMLNAMFARDIEVADELFKEGQRIKEKKLKNN